MVCVSCITRKKCITRSKVISSYPPMHHRVLPHC